MSIEMKIARMKLITLSALATGTLMLGACSQESAEDRQLAAGLACIDTAQSSTDADTCLTKVSGLTSAQSYLIRCSANMIAQGFTGSRIASAFQKLKDNGTSNQTTAMLSYFVFAKNLPNHTSDVTYTNCSASGVKSMIFLSTMFKTATLAASLAGSLEGTNLDPSSPSFDPAQIAAKFQQLYTNNDPTTNSTIGNLAVTAQSSYCASGSAMANQDVCTKLASAITAGSGNAANIGRSLLNLLKQ